MTRLVYAVTSLLLVTACSQHPTTDNSKQILARIDTGAKLTVKDYDEMLTELNRMFEVVYFKADSIVNSGINKTCVRERLKQDSVYVAICADAAKIDSVVSAYIASGKANIDFMKRYNDEIAMAVKKSKKVGLYSSQKTTQN